MSKSKSKKKFVEFTEDKATHICHDNMMALEGRLCSADEDEFTKICELAEHFNLLLPTPSVEFYIEVWRPITQPQNRKVYEIQVVVSNYVTQTVRHIIL